MDKKNILLKVENLRKYFPIKDGFGKMKNVQAVENVSFDIKKGETFGLVGESGCGKTTLGRSILRLLEPTAGKITYDGEVIFDAKRKHQPKMLPFRRKMQIIFQDPSASLDPRMTVGEIIGEALDIHKLYENKQQRTDRINNLLDMVGLNSEHSNRYAHEFSGGQQQRIGVARALAVEPEFIVADEPLSALDVSIQAQVVNLLCDLRDRLSLTMLFISHDLDVVEYLCDRVVVLYLGRVMEVAPTAELFARPLHPYSQALLAASPKPDPEQKSERIALKGDIPSPVNPPSGCVFRTRCPHAIDACSGVLPELRDMGQGRFKACIRDDIALVTA